MPPVESSPESSDSERSKEETISPKRERNGIGKQLAPANDAPPNKDEEMKDDDDDEDEPIEDYVVEDIVGHSWEKGGILYEVKWENYSYEENTHEPEENLDTARDTLEEYFKRIGGRPEKPSKAPGPKKRGRQSTSAMGNGAGRSDSKRARTGGRPPRQGARAASVDVPDRDDPWPKRKTSAWQPPPPEPGAPGNWEDLLLKVETVMVEGDGSKWAYLLWAHEDDDGKKITTKARLASVYTAAPQTMLRFYESHLVFTTPPKTPPDEEPVNNLVDAAVLKEDDIED